MCTLSVSPMKVVVVMVPFPAQGHLNQLLHLSRLISGHGLPVHYVSTTSHSRQAKLRVHGWDPLSVTNIHFHEFSIPSFPSPPPNPNNTNNDTFPIHLQPSFNASTLLRRPVADLIQSLSSVYDRVVVIHDSLMSYVVQDFSLLPNAESYAFHSVSACTLFFFVWERMGKPFGIQSDFLKDLPSIDGCFSLDFVKFVHAQHEFIKLNTGKIYNTSDVIEKPFIDFLAREEISKGKKQWALGPFNPIKPVEQSMHYSLKWLDKQDLNSTLYVSFGTTTSLTEEQIREIATGLGRIEQKFIWVLREADRGDIFEKLAESGINTSEEMMIGNGMIVRDWAPQLEILGHPAIGGFLSHCGWNSCMESISMGVPIAAWPMHSDQPRNAFLISKILGIGVIVREWDKREELVSSESLKKAVKKLMGSKEGDEMRRRAADLGAELRRSAVGGGGGGGKTQLDGFVDHITRSKSD